MIVVTGATGNAGSEVVRALTARGLGVRAFVRDREKARLRLGDNVELAVGRLETRPGPRPVRVLARGGVRSGGWYAARVPGLSYRIRTTARARHSPWPSPGSR